MKQENWILKVNLTNGDWERVITYYNKESINFRQAVESSITKDVLIGQNKAIPLSSVLTIVEWKE